MELTNPSIMLLMDRGVPLPPSLIRTPASIEVRREPELTSDRFDLDLDSVCCFQASCRAFSSCWRCLSTSFVGGTQFVSTLCERICPPHLGHKGGTGSAPCVYAGLYVLGGIYPGISGGGVEYTGEELTE